VVVHKNNNLGGKSSMKKLTAIAVGTLCASLMSSVAYAATIDNPGFESNFNDWQEVEPNGGASISSVERSGAKSAKIDKSGANVNQIVSVDKNSTYEVSGYIRGAGKIRVNIDGSNKSVTRSGTSTNWSKKTVSFNTGGDSTARIYLEYNGNTGRFDDLSITKTGSSSSSSSSSSSGSVGATYNMRKRNTNHSIDGNGGAQSGQQIYLWGTNLGNVNQQWEEIDAGNGFVSFRKKNTGLCIDGGNGGAIKINIGKKSACLVLLV